MFGQQSNANPGGFGSTNPKFGNATSQNNPSGFGTTAFGSVTSGQNAFSSVSGQNPGFGASTTQSSTVFGSSSGFGQTSPSFGAVAEGSGFGQANPSFGGTSGGSGFGANSSSGFASANPIFGSSGSMTSSDSAFGTATTTPSVFSGGSSTIFGSTATTVNIPVFGSTSTGTSAFSQSAQSPFNSKSTTFGGSQFSGLGATSTSGTTIFGSSTTTANNSTFGSGAPVFSTSSISSGQTSFASTTGFSKSGTEKSAIFGAVVTSGPTFGALGSSSSSFKPPGSASIFSAGSTTTSPGSVFGTSTGSFGSTNAGTIFTGSSVFTPSTTATGIFSSAPKFGDGGKPFGTGFSSNASTHSTMSSSSTTSSSVFGCISSTGQQVTSSLPSTTSIHSMFGQAPSSTAEGGSGLFRSVTAKSNKLFNKQRMESTESKQRSGQEGRAKDDQKESRPARALFSKSTQEEKSSKSDENKLAKSSLFLAAISDITSKKEHKSDDKKIHIARTEGKGTDGGEGKTETSPGSSPRIIRRRSTLEDIQKKVAIVVKSVDPSCNNKDFLRKYFQKYGTVKKVFVYPAKESATIHFTSHEEAEAALLSTRYLKPNTPRVQIFWSSYTPRKDSGESPASNSGSKVEKNEVQDELESMQGTSDLYEGEVNVLERPKEQNEAARATDKSSKWKAGSKLSSRSKLRDLKEKSSSRLKSLKRSSVKTSASSKQESTNKPKKGADFISLKSLTNCVAHTAAERVEILENRDKILRMALESKKQVYLATSDAIVGTCPDMCPEKERYLREVRRHLSVYEIVPGTDVLGQNPKCDHVRAVKEYSRSSADQEMPLPHELRPPPVLSMTMDYLLNNIMDSGGDGKWPDWYEYLWSRTRSLRKDITQQDLCDVTSVEVIEKNCRFHIYCAERLCEEDMSTFDEKINNENLTKCLQTLKQMYWDLEKKGIYCRNEAEFRAYVVLMNLNNGDTLREVQQLREEVRESEPVKFATRVYSALNCNNYIKFFKLVQMAPFLYACILHRYFNQVRSCALRTMLKAYRWPGQAPQYPLSDLMRLLQFENDNEAIMFCRHHGFTVEDGKVLIDRKVFIEPDTAMEPRRAIRLIESKQMGSVGEVVNGGPLPPNELHQPHSSFDENGCFILPDIQIGEEDKAISAELETEAKQQAIEKPQQHSDAATASEKAANQLTSDTSQDQPEAQKEQQLIISSDIIKDIAKQLFFDVINEHVTDISQTVMRDVKVYLSSAVWIYDELQDDVLNSVIKEVAQVARQECEREQRELVARRKAEVSALRAKAANVVLDDMIQSIVEQECQLVAEIEYREVEKQLRDQSEHRTTEVIAGELVDRAIQEEVCSVAEMVFEVDVVERLQEIEGAAEATQLLVMTRFLRRWKERFSAEQRRRRSILTFPPAPSLKSPSDQLRSLIPESEGIINGELHLGMNAYATLDSAAKVAYREARLRGGILSYRWWKERRRRQAYSPLCLGSVLGTKLHHRLRELHGRVPDGPVYWKLILSLPDVGPNSSMDDDYAQRTIMWCDWLKAKFTKGTVPKADFESKTELLSLYTTNVDTSGKLGVCVRLVKGFPDEDDEEASLDRSCLLGTSAIMFYVGEADPDHGECYVAEVQSRLQHLLENLPKCSPVPLVIMCPMGSPVTEQNLSMEPFLQEDMISGYKFVTVGGDIDDPEHHNKLVNSLHWTTTQYPEPPQLTSSQLLDTVEDVTSCQYFNTVYQTVGRLTEHSHLLQELPDLLISYYNHVIRHIADVVSDSTLQDLSWPVAEFSKDGYLPAVDWNTPDQLDYLRQTVLSLQLPEYDRPKECDDLEWTDLLDHVWAYVAAVVEEGDHDIVFFSKVKRLLDRLEKKFELSSRSCLCLVDWHMVYGNIPWVDIIQACYEHRLRQTSWTDLASEDDDAQLMAHYFSSKVNNYTPPKEWLEAVRDTQPADSSHLSKGSIPTKRKSSGSVCNKHDNLKVAKFEARGLSLDDSSLSKTTWETEDTAIALNNLLATEKKNNKMFEEFLQKSLQDDSLSDFDLGQTLDSPDSLSPMRRKSLADLRATQNHSLASAHLEGSHSTITDDVNRLDSIIKSQKQADMIFEMRLKSFLID